MLVTPNRLLNPYCAGDGGIIIQDAGRATNNSTYANDFSLINLSPATQYPLGNFWFKARHDVSWSGSRCLYASQVLYNDPFTTESRWVYITIFKATPASSQVYITFYGSYDAFANYYSTSTVIINNSPNWHMITWFGDAIAGQAGFTVNGQYPGIDDFIWPEFIGDYASGSCEFSGNQTWSQGAVFTLPPAPCDYAEVWQDYETIGVGEYTDFWKKFATASGKPKYLGASGELVNGRNPHVYCKTWPGAATLVNSGTSGSLGVSGTQFSLVSGPTQWGQS